MSYFQSKKFVFSEETNDITDKEDVEKQFERYKKLVLLPYNYANQTTGKQFRTLFLKAMNNWIKISEINLEKLSDIINIIHISGLIIDDIEDSSELRRGKPTAHLVFGIPLSMNAGFYGLMLGLDKILKQFPNDKISEASKLFCELNMKGSIGQGLDIYWRDSFTCPTESDYLYMIDCKTTCFFNFGVKLMQLLSENKADFTPFITLIGQYFQIRDDYANLKFDEYKHKKGFAEDLTEGKFSFPIIHAINNNKNDLTLIKILKERTTDVETKKHVIELLESFGSISYTYEKLNDLFEKCCKQLEQFEDNPDMNHLMNSLKIK